MICVDASVAVKWVIAEMYSPQALTLFEDTMAAGEAVIAPTLLPFEVANILRRRMAREGWPVREALGRVDEFFTFPVTFRAPAHLYRDAVALADQFGLAAAYDAHYLVLARSHGCAFWTDDQKLVRQLNYQLPFVRWIGEYHRLTPTR